MNPFWNSHLGKIFVGGCGTQVGLALTCSVMTGVLLFCFVCASTNVLTVGISEEAAALYAPEATATPEQVAQSPPVGVLDSLIGQVRLLQGELEFLRANPPVAVALPPPLPTATPRPFLTANQSGVNMRSGPGTAYSRVGVLPYGQSLEIVGRNENATWWLVATAEGMFGWVSADLVAARSLHSDIPVVTIPSLLVWGTPTPVIPPGSLLQPGGVTGLSEGGASLSSIAWPTTPTPGLSVERQFVENMPSYRRLRGHLLIPPVSASVSPDGMVIAITERIKLYTVTTDGALSTVLLEDTADMGPLGNVVWSPDGEYLALVIGYKEKYCRPCRGVMLIRPADGRRVLLEHPGELELDAPRWTIDGRLLVIAHPGEPADGVAYVYERSGQGRKASGAYVLSSSGEGQRSYPWLPGKTWLVGSTERADAYNAD